MNKYNKPRGTKDWQGQDILLRENLIQEIKEILISLGYSQIETPMFESSDLFKRALGSSSDVVMKEMYIFNDKKDREFVLRPESTAPIARYMVEEKMLNPQSLPQKLFTFGSMFRYDRPQAGRYRQFNQVSIENYSMNKNDIDDLNNILIVDTLLKKLNINNIVVEINNLSTSEIRKQYLNELSNYFNKNKENLSKVSLKRLESNPLRILDSKEKEDILLIKNAPLISSYYDEDTKIYMDWLKKSLKKLNINYKINEKLVRGLDYYEGIVFEFKKETNDKQSQSTIFGGGRYDRLLEQMDNKKVSALGFAGGIERIIISLNEKQKTYLLNKNKPSVYIGILSEKANIFLFENKQLINPNTYINFSTFDFKKQLKILEDLDIENVLWIGDKEIESNKFSIVKYKNKKPVMENEKIDNIITNINNI